MMKLVSMKKIDDTSASPISGADVLAVLDRRLRELESRDRELLAMQLGFESSANSSRAGAAAAAYRAEAESLLQGEPFVPNAVKSIAEIDAIIAERTVIKRALALGNSQKERLAIELAGDVWAANFPEIARLEKRRVMAALELQQINRAREVLRERLTKIANGVGYMPTDGVDLLGLGDVNEEVKWACERVVADGILKQSEIDRARSAND